MNIADCLQEGLLVKTKPDLQKARSSLEMAEHKLELAEKEFEHRFFESAIISAYTSMFHAGRALLFKDGFKERSHFAVYVFVNQKYATQIERKYVNELDSLRLQRHELMYGLEKNVDAQEENADTAIKLASGFLNSIQKIIQSNKNHKRK